MPHEEKLIDDHEKKFEKTEKELEDIKKTVNRIEKQLTVKKATNGLRTKQMVNDIESLKEKDTTLAEKIDNMGNDITEIKTILKTKDRNQDVSQRNYALYISCVAIIISVGLGVCGFIF
jgi:uncharacterized protein YoxC